MQNRPAISLYSRTASVSAFLFFSLMLSIPSGYSYGAGLLLLISLAFLAHRTGKMIATTGSTENLHINGEDRTIACILIAVFVASLLAFLVHANNPKFLDQSTRCLLAIPVLFLLVKAPLRLAFMWAGLAVGALSSAVVAIWQVHYQGIERATGFVTSAIPFGGLALTMSILCVAGMFWAKTQRGYAWHWRIALLVGAAAGGYSSLASGSRGGWLALAPVALLFCIAFLNKKNIKQAMLGVLVSVAGMGALLTMPDSTVRARYELAVQEVTNYVSLNEATSSIGGRLEAWRAAGILIQERPLLGWSVQDYHEELARLVASNQVDPFVLELANTHNNYLEVWLTQGLLGLLALLALLVVPFGFFCKRLLAPDLTVRVLAVSGASLQASFFIFCMTQVILGRNNGIIFFVMTLVILWGSMRHREALLMHDRADQCLKICR